MLIRATKEGRTCAVWLRDDAPDHEIFFAAHDLLVDIGCKPDDISEAFLEMLAKNAKDKHEPIRMEPPAGSDTQ